MNEKIYIAYCTSGLGNRLRPLASAISYCNITKRKLKVYWDIITPNGCLSPLTSLFENSFDLITLDEISALNGKNIKLFTEKGPGHGVEREANRFGRHQLLALSQQAPLFNSQSLGLNEEADIVIVYDNAYLSCVPVEKSIAALRSLIPTAIIRDKVQTFLSSKNLIDQNWYLRQSLKGVHARGTDFPIDNAIEQYVSAISDLVGDDNFFLSTDDIELENAITNVFQNQVISRDDRLHLLLNEGKLNWHDIDSFTISEDQGIDALVDIYILSCTNLVVFHPGSTFAEIARHLHAVLIKSKDKLSNKNEFFIQSAKKLLDRSDLIYQLDLDAGDSGPKLPEETPNSFIYWETLGYQIPFLERLFMNSYTDKPILIWDGELFDKLSAIPFEQFPRDMFDKICPYKEAWSQMETLRSYMKGRKILIVGSETFWVELLCIISDATEVTTVEYREIHWSRRPSHSILTNVTWDQFIKDFEPYQEKYDLIISYSSLEHSGLGRYGDKITPLGDLFTFQLMTRCMKAKGMCAVAVPTGQDLIHYNAHRIYGEKRIQAMEKISNLKYIGIITPDKDYLANDPVEYLRDSWSIKNLSCLPLGQYRQPILCFGNDGFTSEEYSKGQ